jgi:hypothetical protein
MEGFEYLHPAGIQISLANHYSGGGFLSLLKKALRVKSIRAAAVCYPERIITYIATNPPMRAKP